MPHSSRSAPDPKIDGYAFSLIYLLLSFHLFGTAAFLFLNSDLFLLLYQAVYKVLQEAKYSESAFMEKHSSKGVCVNQLVEVTKEPNFWALEKEYCLSERILSVCVF